MEKDLEMQVKEEQIQDEPNLDNAPEVEEEVDFEQAMKNLHMEEGYIRMQAQKDLNDFLMGLAQNAVQEVTLAILIEAGLTTREKVAAAIQKYTVTRVKDLQENLDLQEQVLNGMTEEECSDLKIRKKSVEITKELVAEFLLEAEKPVEEILATNDSKKEQPENVVEFQPKQ